MAWQSSIDVIHQERTETGELCTYRILAQVRSVENRSPRAEWKGMRRAAGPVSRWLLFGLPPSPTYSSLSLFLGLVYKALVNPWTVVFSLLLFHDSRSVCVFPCHENQSKGRASYEGGQGMVVLRIFPSSNGAGTCTPLNPPHHDLSHPPGLAKSIGPN